MRKITNFIIGAVLLVSLLLIGSSPINSGNSSSFNLTVTLQDYTGTGKLVHSATYQSHSYIFAMIVPLYIEMAQTSLGYKDVGNNSRTANSGYNCLGIAGAAGSTTDGIVVGTGTAAVAQSNYALQTLIASGSGAGQLNYGSESFTIPAVVGNTNSYTTSRTVTNASGGTITINEIGIYANMQGTGVGYYGCIIRDLVTQAIVNTHNLVITYTFSTTY